jgi:hypothetical protein
MGQEDAVDRGKAHSCPAEKSDAVVLVREDPRRPFHYVAVETLSGDPGATPIDALINSEMRRRLGQYPNLQMVLGRNAASGEWRILGIAVGDFVPVFQDILRFRHRWVPNETSNPQRLDTFAGLLGHNDRRLHQLAYLEIGRDPIPRSGRSVPAFRSTRFERRWMIPATLNGAAWTYCCWVFPATSTTARG